MSMKSPSGAVLRIVQRFLPGLIFGLSVLGLVPTPSRAAAPHDQPAIERVDEIREKLLQTDLLKGKRSDDRDGRRQMVQWYNFPNWPNWNNWPNWGNFWRNW